jgi:hypothetical protein
MEVNMSFFAKWRAAHPRSWFNLVLAALLFIAPWVVGFSGESAAAWTAWLSAVALAILAGCELIRFAEWEDGVGAGIGIWLIVAPWVAGFATDRAAQWAHIVIGLLAIVFSAWDAWSLRSERPA